MDPLSIIASTTAIAGIASASLEKLRLIMTACTEIHALINEVADISIILREIQQLLFQDAVQLPNTTLLTLLIKARSRLEELNNIVTLSTSQQSSNSLAKVRRFAWLKCRARAKMLQEDLHNVRSNLIIVLTTLNKYTKIQILALL